MKCNDIRENLAAYLDNEIDGAPRQAMDDHMKGCEPCAAERTAQASAWALLDRLDTPDYETAPTAADLVKAVRELDRTTGPISGDGMPAGPVLRLPAPIAATAAAAALLAVAGGFAMLNQGGTVDDPSTIGNGEQVESASAELLDNLLVLEALEVLEDEDLELLDELEGLDEETLEVLGG
jgi:hypothetical protein